MMKKPLFLLPLLATAFLTVETQAQAIDRTWTGGGSNGNWSNADNWSGTGTIQSGDKLIIDGGTPGSRTPYYNTNIMDLPAGLEVAGIDFSGPTFNLGTSGNVGNRIGLDGNITRTAGSSILYVPIELRRDVSIHTDATGSLTLYANEISGSYGLTKTGEGTLTVRASPAKNNSFSGGFTLQAGELILAGVGTGVQPLGTGVTTINGGLLNLTGANALFTGLHGSGGQISTGTGNVHRTLEVNTASHANIYNGVIGDTSAANISLLKSGIGTLTLGGVNTHRGATTVTGGTLLLSATGSLENSAVTVSGGAVLEGRGGSIAEAVVLESAAALRFDLDSALAGPGLDLGDTLTVGANSNLLINLTSAPVAESYQLLQADGGITGTFARVNGTAFTPGDLITLSFGGSDYDFQLLQGANSINLSLQAIPEGSTIALLLMGAAGVLLRRRR